MSMGGSGKLGWMLWKVLNAFMWENRAANGQKFPLIYSKISLWEQGGLPGSKN